MCIRDRHQGDRLIARVSQQALADAVGSVREVVVRVLRDLRSEGVIRTSRDGIEILLPDRLIAELFPGVQASSEPSDRRIGA